MLGKLLKYEFKATGRVFLPLYAMILIVTLLNRFVGMDTKRGIGELNEFGNIATLVLVALFIALVVLTLLITIQRFQKNLLGDEGYLMFTLPTTPRKLVLSKAIVAIVWVIASGIVGVLTFLILFTTKEFIQEFGYVWTQIRANIIYIYAEDIWLFINMGLMTLLSYIAFLCTVYASLAIAQFPKLQKHRSAFAFIVFLILSMLVGWGMGIVCTYITPFEASANTMILNTNIFTIIVIVMLFELTNRILTRHLNLE